MSLSPLDTILDRYTGRAREALLPVLWDVQTAFGAIDPEAVQRISHTLRVPEAEIYGVIGFYAMFSASPTAPTTVHVCTGPACRVAGAEHAIAQLAQGVDDVHVTHAPCLGLCEHAPAALVTRHGMDAQQIAPVIGTASLLSGTAQAIPAVIDSATNVLLPAGLDTTRAETLAEYGDYAGLRHALDTLTPEQVIAEVEASGLVGRGGAAFPTGLKWKFARAAGTGVPLVVCNADESEPGTFKDRALLELRPHLVLEGLAICGTTVGAPHGYIFIRGEYPEAERRVRAAIAEAEAAGLLGDNVLGSGATFRVEVRRGAGAYISGEETALFEAIEGFRGFPRVKPPFPTTHGLFGRPTVINNVETLSVIPGITRHGVEWFRQWGTEQSPGVKLVSVSGHVRRPGVVEIAPGITLRDLLETHCGGVQGTLQAVLMGGAAGTFLTPDEIDVALTFEDLRAIKSTFGSGAIMVFNDTVDLREVLLSLGEFFQHESCGKCYPCQLGTQRQLEIIQRIDAPLPGDAERLRDVGLTMTEASLCGLGQTAALAVLSALDKWPDLVGGSW